MAREYANKKILIVGLGRSGLSAAKYLSGRGANITVTDSRSYEELSDQMSSLKGCDIEYHCGSNPSFLFVKSDLIVLSPGVPLNIEGVRLAREMGKEVVCEMELALDEIKGRVIAITGTNGKSTTTALIGEFLKGAGKKMWVGGNLGNPIIGEISDAKAADYVVLEVSSYQLELTPSLRAGIGILLNITPDHLDRYSSFEQYIKAKALIGRNQTKDDHIIYNTDDQIVVSEIENFRSKKLPISVSKELGVGAWYKKNELHLKADGFDFSVDVGLSKLSGIHNRENIAAASLAASLCGVEKKDIERVLTEFNGLSHRLQFVKEVSGVLYYDDSKGTNVGAVKRSLESFDGHVVLIAGGLDKNTGYADLREIVATKVRCIVAIGEAAQKIKAELSDATDVILCSSMEAAVNKAREKAREGDVVLLSPACASFDMFKDYAHRGNVFAECVRKLEAYGVRPKA